MPPESRVVNVDVTAERAEVQAGREGEDQVQADRRGRQPGDRVGGGEHLRQVGGVHLRRVERAGDPQLLLEVAAEPLPQHRDDPEPRQRPGGARATRRRCSYLGAFGHMVADQDATVRRRRSKGGSRPSGSAVASRRSGRRGRGAVGGGGGADGRRHGRGSRQRATAAMALERADGAACREPSRARDGAGDEQADAGTAGRRPDVAADRPLQLRRHRPLGRPTSPPTTTARPRSS